MPDYKKVEPEKLTKETKDWVKRYKKSKFFFRRLKERMDKAMTVANETQQLGQMVNSDLEFLLQNFPETPTREVPGQIPEKTNERL